MPKLLLYTALSLLLLTCSDPRPQYETLEDYPVYPYADLGMRYTPEATTFKLWSPAAQAARLRLFTDDAPGSDSGESHDPYETVDMEEIDGAWTTKIEEDLAGIYYTFQIKRDGRWLEEATDIYARSVGTNGLRAQVVDLKKTNPEGWAEDRKPTFTQPTDAVIYELHIRDVSLDPRSGIEHQGKFIGLTERGTKTQDGTSTGLDHLIELGVTHVHLLPSFDFVSVDEALSEEAQYNWGYDPQNYNVPEGSYATDPGDGRVRIREFKTLVKALHDAGIRVVMDVVYNHTGRTENSNFQLLIPDYFYRFKEDGSFSDASACGNEIASERPMVRKYIRESVEYWVKEYHIDGFRFDLMGIHDIATMNVISESLHALDSTILIYGEGWKASDSPLPDSLLALKANTPKLQRVAAFSDDLRDGLKGSVFEAKERGFVSGGRGADASIRFGVVAATRHPQVEYDSVNYSSAPWAKQPGQCVNYVSCHDNHTLWDRLALSNRTDPASRRESMHRLALAIVLTSQGIPFLHAGSEFLRSKNGEENSYRSSDGINAIRWANKKAHALTYNYVKNLIALRKAHPAFRMGKTDLLAKSLSFVDTEDDQLLVYRIQDAPGEEWTDIYVAFNGAGRPKQLELPEGDWRPVVDGRKVDPEGLGKAVSGTVYLEQSSGFIWVRE